MLLDTAEEWTIYNSTVVIAHPFHIHINPFQIIEVFDPAKMREPLRLSEPFVWWGIALAVTSLLATALAFFIQTWAQKYTSPTRTAIIFSLEPVFAWITAWLLAGEVLSGRAVAGALLILAGILFVEVKFGK